jgi:hypothetical protein
VHALVRVHSDISPGHPFAPSRALKGEKAENGPPRAEVLVNRKDSAFRPRAVPPDPDARSLHDRRADSLQP